MTDTAGAVVIGELAEETGWSRSHLADRFRDQTGLTPKTAAGLLRFTRAVDLLHDGDMSLPSVAATCGYYDQAHLNRDFRSFAGCTPTQWRRSHLTGLVGTGDSAGPGTSAN
ncbi:AraC family transcriptional regulator [Pseudonocardia sp. NPDC049635]|uniref:helix-turn-helix domain-containing protein n=1 Tax=Pseudonocardia sp. NPDC049635 TaxID=3155506 RepID=UPI0033ECF620